jgi:hypothetical protein
VLIGHYSAAFALKSVEKDASLGWLFLAVQFADILFFPLVLLGIERMSIIPHRLLGRRARDLPRLLKKAGGAGINRRFGRWSGRDWAGR